MENSNQPSFPLQVAKYLPKLKGVRGAEERQVSAQGKNGTLVLHHAAFESFSGLVLCGVGWLMQWEQREQSTLRDRVRSLQPSSPLARQ